MKLPWFLLHDNPQELYTTSDYLVLDFETTTKEHGSPLAEDNDIVLACWQVVRGDQVLGKYKFGSLYEQQELVEDIDSVKFIVCQNLKFELGWLRRCGLDLRSFLGYDTMLAQWVLDGNQRTPRNLSALAARYGVPGKIDLVANLIASGVDTPDISPRMLLEYCQADVEATRQIFIKQQQALTAANQWHLAHVRNLTCSCLADIEFAGLYLDPDRVKEEYLRAITLKEELGNKLATITGGINLNSPKQLADFVYNKLGMEQATDYKGNVITTPSGEPTVNANVIALLVPETEEQKEFLSLFKTYNKQVSLLEKNLDYFKLTCEQRDCKFYGKFEQNIVQTHRLASSGIPILFQGLKKTKSVQMQNIPREYKSLFWSGDPDWVVMEVDGSQLEFRVAVDLGNDKIGYEEIVNGTDIHTFTANVLYKEGDPEICVLSSAKERRQQSKKHTFRPLYGGGSGSPALVAYCEYFKEKYTGISATQRTWALRCVDKKQFTTPYGMTFFFPDTKMNRSGYINNTTSIYNYPVQGFATGEIIPIALVYFWHRTKHLRLNIFSTIHDSIACRVHKDDVEEAKLIAKQCLTLDVYEFLKRVYCYDFHTPLGLGIKAALHWGEGEEYKLDVFPDGTEVIR
jgi:DNA polymerase I-like protein with 3'-5' exonuclease and polymerase domains